MKPGGSDSSLEAQIEAWRLKYGFNLEPGDRRKSLRFRVLSLQTLDSVRLEHCLSGKLQRGVVTGLDDLAELGVFGSLAAGRGRWKPPTYLLIRFVFFAGACEDKHLL